MSQTNAKEEKNIFVVAKSLTTQNAFQIVHWLCNLLKHPVPADTVTLREFLYQDCCDGTLFIKLLSKVKGRFITHNRAPKDDVFQIQENLKTFINEVSELVPKEQLLNSKSYSFDDQIDLNVIQQPWLTSGKLYDMVYNHDNDIIIKGTKMLMASFVLLADLLTSKKLFKGPYLTLSKNEQSGAGILNVDIGFKDVGTHLERRAVEKPTPLSIVRSSSVSSIGTPKTPSTPVVEVQIEKKELLDKMKQELEAERVKRLKEIEKSVQLHEQKLQKQIEDKLEKRYKQSYEERIQELERQLEIAKQQQGVSRSGSNLEQSKKLLQAIDKLNATINIKDEQIKTLTEQLEYVQEKYDKLQDDVNSGNYVPEVALEEHTFDEEKLEDEDDEFNAPAPSKVSKLDDLLDAISDEESGDESEEELQEQEPEELTAFDDLDFVEHVVVKKTPNIGGPIELEELTLDDDDDLMEVSVIKKK